jgi:hypothetical protein
MSEVPDKQGRVGAAKGGRPPGTPTYSPETIDAALLALAYTRRSKEAREQLELAGVSPLPTARTIARWGIEFSGRLAELTEKHGAEIERHSISQYQTIVTKAAAVTDMLVEKTGEAAERGELAPKDLANAAKSMATVVGIITDKILIVQGKPTSIIGHKSGEEALRTLARKYAPPVDSTAEESPKELES